MTEHTHIQLAHGNGGRLMRELIEQVIAPRLNPALDTRCDAAILPPVQGRLLITTDGFTVQPLEFPGGDIGSLAVHGTVNDLAVAGAEPRWLTLNLLIEEGFEIARLARILDSLGQAARACGVQVVAGDTKVVGRGEGGGLYLATTGVGVQIADVTLSPAQIAPGDQLLISGPVGDHGTAVMLARQAFGLSGALESDAASVLPLTRALLDLPGLRFMRDPTRGGLATVAHELCQGRTPPDALDIILQEGAIPIRDPVRSVCQMLGYDPLFLACEGRVLAVVAAEQAQEALRRWQALPQGSEAALIGSVRRGRGRVILHTLLGGERLLDELESDPLPRIC